MMTPSWFCPHCHIALVQNEKGHACPQCGFVVRGRDGYFDAGMPLRMSFPEERTKVLASIEKEHFWFGHRDALLRSILHRIAPAARSLIEMGCGTGRFLASLDVPAGCAVGVEAFENSIQAAAARRPHAVLLRGDVCHVPMDDSSFDVAVSMDVLEHVEPHPFLSEVFRLVRPGGWLLLSVPSSPHLWSEADEKAGHRCRYTLKMITEELETNGWQLSGHTHYQYFLYPLMLLSRVFFKGKNRMEKHPPVWMNKCLGLINAFEVRFFSRCSLPWGSSIIVWARKI